MQHPKRFFRLKIARRMFCVCVNGPAKILHDPPVLVLNYFFLLEFFNLIVVAHMMTIIRVGSIES